MVHSQTGCALYYAPLYLQFILRNIIEQVVEWQATLYITFVDFEKAFNSVHRGSMGNHGELWN